MAEQICRALRDGTLEGELAVALSIEDSLKSPFGFHAFDHFLASLAANISAAKSQACGIVLVAVDRSPLYYQKFLQTRGLAGSPSLQWLSLLDCYSDPLGWKMKLGNMQIGPENPCIMENVTVFRDIKDIDKLLSIIINLGGGVVGEGKARFSVAIDSVSTVLRHTSLSSIAKLIASLRSCERVSSMIWLMHSDLHESRHSVALNYISTMVASLESMVECANGETSTKNLFGLEKNLVGGKFLVRMKRRNGRVKILVQFNLHLSEKERADRAKVVLPFEHQGNGEDIKIYDGRQSLPEGKRSQLDGSVDLGKGEIHYIRDSDDELPDSDEDPDDDLDI